MDVHSPMPMLPNWYAHREPILLSRHWHIHKHIGLCSENELLDLAKVCKGDILASFVCSGKTLSGRNLVVCGSTIDISGQLMPTELCQSFPITTAAEWLAWPKQRWGRNHAFWIAGARTMVWHVWIMSIHMLRNFCHKFPQNKSFHHTPSLSAVWKGCAE